MSHGHDHKKYKAVFGDIERSTKGLFVLCDGEAPKAGTDTKQMDRTVCLAKPYTACKTCEHSTFKIRLRKRIGDEVVACPRWTTPTDRLEKIRPRYEEVRREQCLVTRPYDYCSFCPNKEANKPAEVSKGWWERRFWKER